LINRVDLLLLQLWGYIERDSEGNYAPVDAEFTVIENDEELEAKQNFDELIKKASQNSVAAAAAAAAAVAAAVAAAAAVEWQWPAAAVAVAGRRCDCGSRRGRRCSHRRYRRRSDRRFTRRRRRDKEAEASSAAEIGLQRLT
jgi:hypothetical protein